MKNYLLLTAFLSAGLLHAAPPNPRIAEGKLKDHVYENEFFGLTYALPSLWTVEARQPVKKFMAAGGDALVKDRVLSEKSVKADQSHTYNLLQAISPQADSITGYSPNISIVAEHLPEDGPITTADAYLRNSINIFTRMTSAHYEVLEDRKKVTIGGREFLRATFRSTTQRPDSPLRLSILQSQYVTVINGYAFQLILSAGTEKRMEELRSSFEKLNFKF